MYPQSVETASTVFFDAYFDDVIQSSLLVLAQQAVQLLMELDVEYQIGAGHYQRSDARRTYRNGYRHSRWDSKLGTLELQIPKLRNGSYYPVFLNHSDFEKHLDKFVKSTFTLGVDELGVALFLETILPAHIIRSSDQVAFISVFANQRRLRQIKHLSCNASTLIIEAIYLQADNCWLIVLLDFDSGKYIRHEISSSLDFAFWSMLLRKIQSHTMSSLNRIISEDLHDLRYTLDVLMPEVDWQHTSTLTRVANQPELIDAVSDLSIETGESAISAAVDWRVQSFNPTSILQNAA